MKVQVSSDDALRALVASLTSADCLVRPIDATSCRVLVPRRDDRDEAMLDLRFYIAAWAAQHPEAEVALSR